MKAKRVVEVFMILRCRFSSSVPKTIEHASFSAKCNVRLCVANISKSSILNIFPLVFCGKENPTNTFAIRPLNNLQCLQLSAPKLMLHVFRQQLCNAKWGSYTIIFAADLINIFLGVSLSKR